MRVLVYQIAVNMQSVWKDDRYRYMHYSIESGCKYARQHNYDYYLQTHPVINHYTPHYEKFYVFDLLKRYSKVLYLDVDVLVNPLAPDICSLFRNCEFGCHFETASPGWSPMHDRWIRGCYQMMGVRYRGEYFNSGVMLLDERLLEKVGGVNLKKYDKHLEVEHLNWFRDQGLWNIIMQEHDVKKTDLGREWHHFTQFYGDSTDAYIVHCNRRNKEFMRHAYDALVCNGGP